MSNASTVSKLMTMVKGIFGRKEKAEPVTSVPAPSEEPAAPERAAEPAAAEAKAGAATDKAGAGASEKAGTAGKAGAEGAEDGESEKPGPSGSEKGADRASGKEAGGAGAEKAARSEDSAKAGTESAGTGSDASEEPASAKTAKTSKAAESAKATKAAKAEGTEDSAESEDLVKPEEHASVAEELSANEDDTQVTSDEVLHKVRKGAAPAPEDLPVPNYDELTLPSIRARLRKLTIDEVRELRAYEVAHQERPEFVKMYDNRITKLQNEEK